MDESFAFYFYNTDTNRYDINIIDSKELIDGIKINSSANLKRFKEINQDFMESDKTETVGIEYLLQSIVLTDFNNIFPNEQIGDNMRTLLLENQILKNNVKTRKEIENLKIWLKENDYLKDVYPYDKVLLEVNKVLEDGILTQEEGNYILEVFESIINPQSNNENDMDFKGKTFCLTGEFETANKSEISKKIQALGGIEKSGVSSKLDYLIVGSVGSEAWKFGKIGGKQAKALELNEKGAKIEIIDEDILNI